MQWHSNRGIIMRFLKGIFLFGITIALCPPAFAVTKCVPFDSGTYFQTNSSNRYFSDWKVPIVNDYYARGVGYCGSQNGGASGTISDNLTVSGTPDDNIYCWCKMTSPANSPWVFYQAYTSAGNCLGDCAYNCGNELTTGGRTNVRYAMLSNLSDSD